MIIDEFVKDKRFIYDEYTIDTYSVYKGLVCCKNDVKVDFIIMKKSGEDLYKVYEYSLDYSSFIHIDEYDISSLNSKMNNELIDLISKNGGIDYEFHIMAKTNSEITEF